MQRLHAKTFSALLIVSLSGCADHGPVRYTDVESSAQWSPNTQDKTGRTPLAYTSPRWGHYTAVVVEPTTLYTGADNQFGDLTVGETLELRRMMDTRFSQALAAHFTVLPASARRPGTLRVRLTLTGAEKNTPVLTTVSRFDIGMGAYNLAQSLRDKRGAFSGWVAYVAEVYDNDTGELLTSFASQQYPTVYDIGATRGSLAAAQAGIERGAAALAKALAQRG